MSSSSAESPCKKQKTTKSVVDPGPVYTLQCLMGNPNIPQPSFLKAAKKSDIQKALAGQGLDTTGTKEVLLHRLRTELPNVIFEFDGNKVLNQMVLTFINYFEWEDGHLFRATMPRRGDLPDGALSLRDSMVVTNCHKLRTYEEYCDKYGEDIDKWPIDPQELRVIRKDIGVEYTVEDMRKLRTDESALGTKRVLEGSITSFLVRDYPKFSFDDLKLEEGDAINILYDFGDENLFTVRVLKVEQDKAIQDIDHMGAKLLSRGKSKTWPQYVHDEDEGSYGDDVYDNFGDY